MLRGEQYFLIGYAWRFSSNDWSYDSAVIKGSPIEWMIESKKLNRKLHINQWTDKVILSAIPISKEEYKKYHEEI
jgi:hypothetical protein